MTPALDRGLYFLLCRQNIDAPLWWWRTIISMSVPSVTGDVWLSSKPLPIGTRLSPSISRQASILMRCCAELWTLPHIHFLPLASEPRHPLHCFHELSPVRPSATFCAVVLCRLSLDTGLGLLLSSLAIGNRFCHGSFAFFVPTSV